MLPWPLRQRTLKETERYCYKNERIIIILILDINFILKLKRLILIYLKTETVLKSEYSQLYLNRINRRPANTPQEHWTDAIRLSKLFNEHPITFKRP